MREFELGTCHIGSAAGGSACKRPPENPVVFGQADCGDGARTIAQDQADEQGAVVRRKLNVPISHISLYWRGLETGYFGWNTSLGSKAELFADGLAVALLAVTFAFAQQAPSRIEVRTGCAPGGFPAHAEMADG